MREEVKVVIKVAKVAIFLMLKGKGKLKRTVKREFNRA